MSTVGWHRFHRSCKVHSYMSLGLCSNKYQLLVVFNYLKKRSDILADGYILQDWLANFNGAINSCTKCKLDYMVCAIYI